eukprot:6246629-Karenia_brevis.AAC.1
MFGVLHQNDNSGKKPSLNQWKKISGESKGYGFYMTAYMTQDCKNGGKGQRGALRQFFLHNHDSINANQPNGQKWKLSQWVKATKAGNTVPGSEEANK